MKFISLAQLILACSASDDSQIQSTLYALVQSSSQGHAFYIEDMEGHLYTPSTKKSVLSIAAGFEHTQKSYRGGLTGLHASYLHTYKMDLESLFSSCTHIELASLVLEDLFMTHKVKDLSTLHVALADYFDPLDPDGFQAIEFGARVLSWGEVDVQKIALEELEGTRPVKGPTFVLERHSLTFSGQGSQAMPSLPGQFSSHTQGGLLNFVPQKEDAQKHTTMDDTEPENNSTPSDTSADSGQDTSSDRKVSTEGGPEKRKGVK